MKLIKTFSVVTAFLLTSCQSNETTINTSTTSIVDNTTNIGTITTSSTESTKTVTEPLVTENTTKRQVNESTTILLVTEQALNWGNRGLYGGSYYNYLINNPDQIHYIHGVYQHPVKDYYNENDFQLNGTNSALDYYLSFGISKMTDNDFKYENFHHYYHNLNRTILENETIRIDIIISCHPNATFLCPENTETICLLNGTIYCMSQVSVVVPCIKNNTLKCVKSTVPCAKNCVSNNKNLEEISLPCLANIIIKDVYEDRNGMTLNKVGGTFILVPALKIEERMFCVSVIVDPIPPSVPT